MCFTRKPCETWPRFFGRNGFLIGLYPIARHDPEEFMTRAVFFWRLPNGGTLYGEDRWADRQTIMLAGVRQRGDGWQVTKGCVSEGGKAALLLTLKDGVPAPRN
ncbi:MAG: hypothetical protein C7B43_12240 [Sulfobacillus benefaciens]|uniref:Uncharacterized protein n=1 Tax=Sulfobacillus benefaciens TaxID=453960 RepID=A0A2T2WYA0_9FIRM|nr:MAG: hypothetical protein C7B43_12240 [Sulfobacillus benefaciens]HBQ93743.1 hypothetical protein [Sulfobacillus sp.]